MRLRGGLPSTIAGVVTAEGRAVDPASLHAARRILSSRVEREIEIQQAPGVALLQGAAVREGPERAEPDLGGNGERSWIAVADANLWEPVLSGTAATGRLLAAFMESGLAGVAGIVGDFSFGVWEGSRRRLVLARDVVGLRPLLYAQPGERLVFASSLRAVLALLGGAPLPNLPLLREYLVGESENWPRETAYEGVYRLLPGHALEWRDGRLSLFQYDRLLRNSRGLPPGGDWVGEFQGTLEAVLADRLSVASRPSLLAGGGLDSSVLAVLAQDLLPSGRDVASPLLVSIGFPGFDAADELSHFQVLARACGALKTMRFDFDSRVCSPLEDSLAPAEPELSPTSNLLRRLAGRLARKECTSVLMGEGGDSLFSSGLYHRPELLLSMPLLEIFRELPFFAAVGEPRAATVLVRSLARTLLPPVVLSALRRSRAGGEAPPPWLESSEALDGRLPERSAVSLAVPPGLDRAGELAYRETFGATQLAGVAEMQALFADAGLVLLLPYLDRRVIELVLRMPMKLRAHRGETRQLLRVAAPSSLPRKIRHRRGKADLSGPAYRWIVGDPDRIADLFADSRAEAVGLLRSRPLLRFLDQVDASQPPVHDRVFRLVHRAVSLECWLRRPTDRIR